MRNVQFGHWPGVLVGEGAERCGHRDPQDLHHGVLAQSGGLAKLAPVDISSDEQAPYEATNNAEEEERDKLEEEPGLAVLHVEEDAVLVTEGVDGLEDKSRD